MSAPPNPRPTVHSQGQGPPNATVGQFGSTAPSLIRAPRPGTRSVSVPAAAAAGHGSPHQVVQVVQMTPQARRLQPELVSVMKRVQDIEKDFEQQEERLRISKEEMEAQHMQRQQELLEWQQQKDYEFAEKEHQLETDKEAFTNRMQWEKERIQKERDDLQRMRTEGQRIMDLQEPVTVEVGGDKFRTELSTLSKCRDSIFPNLVKAVKRREESREASDPNRPKRDPYIFIDRDGRHFKFILNYLRQGDEVMKGSALRKADKYDLQEILYEVRYYQLSDLERLVMFKMASLEKPIIFNTLITGQLFKKPNQTPPSAASRLKYITAKEINIKGKNLTEILFDQVVFHHPISFEGCLLVKAVFKECRFESTIKFIRSDLTNARFENCQGVQLSLRFCFENSNTEGMAFQPPLVNSDD